MGCTLLLTVAEKWVKPNISGDIPPPRSSSTMSAVGSNLYLFGGLSNNIGWLSDVYMFDTGVYFTHVCFTVCLTPSGIEPMRFQELKTEIVTNTLL